MTRPRRWTATRVVALLVAALTLLGVQLFLPGAAIACGPVLAGCCCADEASGPADGASSSGCDCSISQPTPVPAAEVAPGTAYGPQFFPAENADDVSAVGVVTVSRRAAPPSRSRAAPTQALLETFRN